MLVIFFVGQILIIFDLGLACFVGVVLLLYTDLNNNIEFVVGWVGGDCHSYLSCVELGCDKIIFYNNKNDFRAFFCCLRPAFGRGSLEYFL